MTNETKAIVTWTQEYREHQFKDCCPTQQAFYQRGFVEGADWKDHQFKEELGLIIEWFDHIAQIADDRKTLNGFVMQDSDALDEIKCLARSCSEYISML